MRVGEGGWRTWVRLWERSRFSSDSLGAGPGRAFRLSLDWDRLQGRLLKGEPGLEPEPYPELDTDLVVKEILGDPFEGEVNRWVVCPGGLVRSGLAGRPAVPLERGTVLGLLSGEPEDDVTPNPNPRDLCPAGTGFFNSRCVATGDGWGDCCCRG